MSDQGIEVKLPAEAFFLEMPPDQALGWDQLV
jgi:hypothetical protein